MIRLPISSTLGLRLAGGDGKLNVRLGILASGIKRNKVILGDAAFLKLGNDSERGIFIIVYQIDTFVRRNLNDFIQEHVVENAVAGELQNGGGRRSGSDGILKKIILMEERMSEKKNMTGKEPALLKGY